MNQPSAKAEFLARLDAAVRKGILAKLTLGRYRGADATLKNLFVRPIRLRAGPRLSFVYRHVTKDITKNFPPDEGVSRLTDLIGAEFLAAHLFTTEETVELAFEEGRAPRITWGKPVHAAPPAASHDRRKQRLIDPSTNPWLHALGVTTAAGMVCDEMIAKFRQINKFVELLSSLLAEMSASSPGSLRIMDMGCGKGYLTFATYGFLQSAGWQTKVSGIEARSDLVALGNRVARENGFQDLSFECGTIANVAVANVDVLVALHACDTATDDAIAKGILAGAKLILVAPCCHKELRPQLQPPPPLSVALKHGIVCERQAELVTDSLRAALLEWAGYRTKVFEFISPEHTAKNLMIAAIKRRSPVDQDSLAQHTRELAAFYGLKHQRLAQQLDFTLDPTGSA